MKGVSTEQGRAGQSTVEVLVAILILATAFSGAILVIFGGQSLIQDAGESSRALRLARENLEETAVLAKTGFAAIASASSTRDGFVLETLVEDIAERTKRITSRVSWDASPLRVRSEELVTLVTDWYAVVQSGGDTGGGSVSGDWQNPRTLGSVDLGPGVSATDLDVMDKIVYLSADASDPKKHDFFIVDATNGLAPAIIGSFSTGPGLNAVDAIQDYAFAAGQETNNELVVIDVRNRNAPALLTSFALPGISGNSEGRTVFYLGGKIFIGTNKATGPEFHAVDVSDPANPSALGAYEVNENVNDIHVDGNLAYLATDKEGAGLLILDVSDPSNITLAGQSYLDDANAVWNAVPGLTLLGPDYSFALASTTDPGAIVPLGSIAAGGTVNDIVSRDYLAFIGTSDSNREFQVVNISSSTSPVLHSSFNFPQVATGVDYEDNLVYVSVRSNDALRIITSSP